MAGTVSWERLRELASFRAEQGCAISLYLNLEPSVAPTAGDAATRINSLLDGGEKSDAATRGGLSHGEREALKADFDRIRRYFADEFERAGAHGLAVFLCGMANVWTPLELAEPVPDGIRVGRQFYLAPLVPLVGRGDGAIVAFVGREQGQLYRLRAGRLQEIVTQFDHLPRRHDQGGWAQAGIQRRLDRLAHAHLRSVAEELERQVRRMYAPSVVVVGPSETRAEFVEVLSPDARNAVIGVAQAKAHAGPNELLEVAEPILEAWRAGRETENVSRWREEAGRGGRAAAGWEETLEAASDARVELLLFQDGVERRAFQCPRCGRTSTNDGSCPLDGTRMEARDDGIDLAVHQTLAHGGKVWAVRHHQDLEPVEGIGAILRY